MHVACIIIMMPSLARIDDPAVVAICCRLSVLPRPCQHDEKSGGGGGAYIYVYHDLRTRPTEGAHVQGGVGGGARGPLPKTIHSASRSTFECFVNCFLCTSHVAFCPAAKPNWETLKKCAHLFPSQLANQYV